MVDDLTCEQGNPLVAIRKLIDCFCTVFKTGPAFEVGSDPTARLQSCDQFQNTIQQHSSRSRRGGNPFSLLTIALSQNYRNDRCLRLLADLLQHRLRLCDEAGLLENGNIAVVLPATLRSGALNLADDLQQMLDQHGIAMQYTVDEFPVVQLTENRHDISPDQAAPLVLPIPTPVASLASSRQMPT